MTAPAAAEAQDTTGADDRITVTALIGPDGLPIRTPDELNERGQVLAPADGESNMRAAVVWERGHAVRLAPDAQDVFATDLSDRGEAVGGVMYAGRSTRAFTWRDRRLRELPTGIEERGGYGQAVNDRGQVVGNRHVLDGDGRPVIQVVAWDRTGEVVDARPAGESSWPVPDGLNDRGLALVDDLAARRPGVWRIGGGIMWLPTLTGESGVAEAVAINEAGQVAGWSLFPDPPVTQRAVLWDGGRVVDLGTLGGPQSTAYDLNDRGQVVGDAGTAEGAVHAFVWQRGRMTDLGTLGGRSSSALAVNERGQVVGVSQTADGEHHAFLWERGRMTDLGALLDAQWSTAQDINDRGQILGTDGGTGEAVLWTLPRRPA